VPAAVRRQIASHQLDGYLRDVSGFKACSTGTVRVFYQASRWTVQNLHTLREASIRILVRALVGVP
jgi:hypothetical protein